MGGGRGGVAGPGAYIHIPTSYGSQILVGNLVHQCKLSSSHPKFPRRQDTVNAELNDTTSGDTETSVEDLKG